MDSGNHVPFDLEVDIEEATQRWVKELATYFADENGNGPLLRCFGDACVAAGIDVPRLAERSLDDLRAEHGRVAWLLPEWWTWRRLARRYRGRMVQRLDGAVS